MAQIGAQRFGRLKTAVFVAVEKVRRGIVGTLEAQGFRNILQADSIESFLSILKATNIDLIISITRTDTLFIGDVVRDLRFGLLDTSPFPVILALLPSADEEHVRSVINSGVDDLLLFPLSSEALSKRIGLFTQDRRPFVITHNYIGPDRRQNPRPGENSAPLIKVPNPVRSRVAGVDDAEIQRAIADGILMVDQYKQRQNGIQLLWLLDRFRGGREEPATGEMLSVVAFLSNCGTTCEDIARRAKNAAEREIREKAIMLSGAIQELVPAGENAEKGQLVELTKSIQNLVDFISVHRREELKL